MGMLYPIFLQLENQNCLVVGGGAVAERKVLSLLETGAAIQVVAPEATEKIRAWAASGRIKYLPVPYAAEHLNALLGSPGVVIVATNNPSLNHQVFTDCKAKGLLVNVVDDPEYCSFFVPAVVNRGSLRIAISTEGKSPILARRIREQLEAEFGSEYEEFLELLGMFRQEIRQQIPEEKQRKQILEDLITDELIACVKNNQLALVKERISQCLSYWLD